MNLFVDCKYGEWTPFGPCSEDCGSGVQTLRKVRIHGDSIACPEEKTKEIPCQGDDCPTTTTQG